MITIGIPKGLFYYQHNVLWESFFKAIGCRIIVSEDTNKEILDNGVKHCSNETCLPVKVFHGHVYSLKDKVDYIFIPRYTSLDKNEYACPKFCGLPDMTLLNLKYQIKVIEVKLHLDMQPELTFESLKELSGKLGLKYSVVKEAFRSSLSIYEAHCKKQLDENSIDYQDGTSPALSVLGHPYMIYDNYLSMKLIKKLKAKGINVYTPISVEHEVKRKNAYPFQGKVFWDIGFENLGSAFTFAECRSIKGIIYLTPFACGIDAFVVEFIERRFKSKYSVPFLKLTVDEHTGEAGFDTRIEAFLDMVV